MPLNILWITCDELKTTAVSSYGNRLIRMPAAERLAKQGALFENAFVPVPKCIPCRPLLLTGRYAHVDGLRTMSCAHFGEQHFFRLGAGQPSLLTLFKAAGYRLSLAGKNHVLRPEAAGILDDAPDFTGMRPVEYAGVVPEAMQRAYFGGRVSGSFDESTFIDAIAVNQTLRFLENAGDKPFFALLDIGEPHPPYKELPRFADPIPLASVPVAEVPPIGELPPVLQAWRKAHDLEGLTDTERRRILRAYWSQAMWADAQLGRVLDVLDRLGLAENTLVIWGSDHGDFAGEYGCYEKWDTALYDCLTRVPLLFRLPGTGWEGRRLSSLVELIDVAPSILELCGMECPAWMHGRSLVPLLRGGDAVPHRDAVFSQGGVEPAAVKRPGLNYQERLLRPYWGKQRTLIDHPEALTRAHMVRTETHKLIYRLSGEHELYDLQNDPGERQNLYHRSELQQVRLALEARLLRFFAETQQDTPQITELWA